MKIFVISLLNSKERRNSIQEQFARLGLEFEYVDAVAGKLLSEEEIRQACDPEAISTAPRWLSKGVIGCALSHRIAYQKVAQNHECALVLQDDAILPDDISGLLESITPNIKANEVILLHGTSFQTVHLSRFNSRKLVPPYEILFPLQQVDIPGSALGFVISRGAAQSLAEKMIPVQVSTDSWRFFVEQGMIGLLSMVYPLPLKSGAFKSEIDYLGVYYSPFISYAAKMVNRYKVPLVYSFLKRRRMQVEARMRKAELVDQISEFDYERLG